MQEMTGLLFLDHWEMNRFKFKMLIIKSITENCLLKTKFNKNLLIFPRELKKINLIKIE